MRSLIFCFLILGLSACQKYGKGYVRGTVNDAITGKPIEGIPVSIKQKRMWTKGQSDYTESVVGNAVTGPDGTYRIAFRKQRGWQYTYYIVAGGNAEYIDDNPPRELTNKKTAVDFGLYQKAYAIVRLTKTTIDPVRLELKVGDQGLSSTAVVQSTPFTDSLVHFVFNVRGNCAISACAKTYYADDTYKSDYCASPQYISPGDTAIFHVSFN